MLKYKLIWALMDLSVLAMLTVPAGLLALVMWATGLAAWLSPAGWIIASPLLYVAWLLLVLLNSALQVAWLPKDFKPRRLDANTPGAGRRMVGVIASYQRVSLFYHLPLGRRVSHSPLLRPLLFRACAPAHHVSPSASVFGTIFDPDLTHIGPGTTIGDGATLVAHVVNRAVSQDRVFHSAPIRIGQGVTIGGHSYIAMGVTIGDGAIVQQVSYVAPFTTIGPGETWGGNPARRLDTAAADERSADDNAVDDSHRQAARALIVESLALKTPDDGPLDATHCPQWDSLGCLAISAALFSRHGVRLSPQRTMALRDEQAVARAIAQGNGGAAEPTPATTRDAEMLPLANHDAALAGTARLAQQKPNHAKQALVIAANFTVEPIAPALRGWCGAFGIDATVRFVGFDQVAAALLAPEAPFAEHADAMSVVLLCAENLPGAEALDATLDAIERFGDLYPGRTLHVGTLPPAVATRGAEVRDVDALRVRWRQRLVGMAHVNVLDTAGSIERLGAARAGSDAAAAELGAPYSPDGFAALAAPIARIVRAAHVPPAKVIALDADGVLWGGVVGEDGREGIALGPEPPGSAFIALQQALIDLHDRGVMLTIVSRNESADVWDVFDHHPHMLLKREHLAAARINWQRKSANLRELADELGLGLDAFVFIDDDPANRHEVTTALPEAHVVPMPADPGRYAATLGRLWLFDTPQVTAVDASRTRMMHDEQRRQTTRDAAASYEAYLADLKLRVTIRPPADDDWPRVAQLSQRTNQFNLTLERRTIEQFRTLGASHEVLLLHAADRFGDYGDTGLAVLADDAAHADALRIDTFLLSCRVLGRGVERALLYAMIELARAHGRSRLVAPWVVGPRNQPVRDFAIDAGFERRGDRLELCIGDTVAPPEHVALDLRLPAVR